MELLEPKGGASGDIYITKHIGSKFGGYCNIIETSLDATAIQYLVVLLANGLLLRHRLLWTNPKHKTPTMVRGADYYYEATVFSYAIIARRYNLVGWIWKMLGKSLLVSHWPDANPVALVLAHETDATQLKKYFTKYFTDVPLPKVIQPKRVKLEVKIEPPAAYYDVGFQTPMTRGIPVPPNVVVYIPLWVELVGDTLALAKGLNEWMPYMGFKVVTEEKKSANEINLSDYKDAIRGRVGYITIPYIHSPTTCPEPGTRFLALEEPPQMTLWTGLVKDAQTMPILPRVRQLYVSTPEVKSTDTTADQKRGKGKDIPRHLEPKYYYFRSFTRTDVEEISFRPVGKDTTNIYSITEVGFITPENIAQLKGAREVESVVIKRYSSVLWDPRTVILKTLDIHR